MRYQFDGAQYAVVLRKGEELLAALQEFVQQSKVGAASLQGIGGTLEVELGFYNLEGKRYQWRTFVGTREIVSLAGTLSVNEQGAPVWHLHGVFGDEHLQTVGGHVRKLIVGGTCEFFVRPFAGALVREQDDETGLLLLTM